jgi:hypothetical protein
VQLEGLHMKFPEIDTYIAKFKELARQVGYTMGNPEMVCTFVKGRSLQTSACDNIPGDQTEGN